MLASTADSRLRALRLLKRVARAIDDLGEFPRPEAVIAACTTHTLRECKSSFLYYLLFAQINTPEATYSPTG